MDSGGWIRRFKRIDWIRTPPIPNKYDVWLRMVLASWGRKP
jgi:hypothetical protein